MATLLKLRFHLNRLFWQHTSRVQQLVIAAFVIILSGLMLGIGSFAFYSFRFLLLTDGGGPELMLYALYIGLSLLFLLFAISSIVTFSGIAYYAQDLGFFFSLPIHPGLVAREKVLENLVVSGWGVLALGLPIIISYGLVAEVGVGFFIAAILGLVILSVASVIIGSGIAIAGWFLLRHAPKWLTWAVFIAGIWLLVRLITRAVIPDISRIETLTSEGQSFTLLTATNPISHVLPSYGVALMIASAVGQQTSASIIALMLAGIFALGFVLYLLTDHWYFIGWQAKQSFMRTAPIFQNSQLFTNRFALWEKRELVQITRDARSASQIGFVAILYIFFIFITLFARRAHGLPSSWEGFVIASLVGVAGYVASTIFLRFVFPSMSLEGNGSWLLWSTPVSLARILRAKWTVMMVFAAGIGLAMAMTVVGVLHYSYAIELMLSLHLVGICLAVAAIQLGLGMVYPNFRESDPGVLSTTAPGLLATVFSLLLVAVEAVLVSQDFKALTEGASTMVIIHIAILWVAAGLLISGWVKRAYVAAQKYSF